MAGYASYIVDAANQYGIDPNIALAIAARETGGDDVNAINMADGGGLMQITDGSAADYGVNDLYPDWAIDPQQNALGGMLILKKKIDEQGGDVWAGVRAYNGAGPMADQYLSQVQQNYNNLGGSGKGTFNFQAKDAQNRPFLNILTHLRTSDPNEPFDYKSISEIMAQTNPDIRNAIDAQKLTSRDYVNDTNFMNPDVAKLVKPTSQTLMQNRIDEIKDNMGQQILQNNLRKGISAINLINKSNNVDNKGMYSGLMKSIGIDVPSNVDQYANSGDMLDSMIQDAENDRKYNMQVQKAQFEQQQRTAQQGLLRDKLNHMNKMYSMMGGV